MNIFLVHNTENLKEIEVFVEKLSEQIKSEIQIINLTKKMHDLDVGDILTYEKDLSKEIATADVVICECTDNSDHLPFIYNATRVSGRPLFVTECKGGKIEITKSSTKSFKVFLCKYTTQRINTFINLLLEQIDSLIKKKFILQINPQISSYLDWRAEHSRSSKAEVIRQAVNKTIQRDKDYQLLLEKLVI